MLLCFPAEPVLGNGCPLSAQKRSLPAGLRKGFAGRLSVACHLPMGEVYDGLGLGGLQRTVVDAGCLKAMEMGLQALGEVVPVLLLIGCPCLLHHGQSTWEDHKLHAAYGGDKLTPGI